MIGNDLEVGPRTFNHHGAPEGGQSAKIEGTFGPVQLERAAEDPLLRGGPNLAICSHKAPESGERAFLDCIVVALIDQQLSLLAHGAETQMGMVSLSLKIIVPGADPDRQATNHGGA